MIMSSHTDNEARADALFLILTRPPMRWGVPFEALVVNGVLTFFIGLWLGSPLYWAVGLIIHFPMRVIASKDHNFFRIYRLWLFAKFESAKKASLWGGSMLSPLPTSRKIKEIPTCV